MATSLVPDSLPGNQVEIGRTGHPMSSGRHSARAQRVLHPAPDTARLEGLLSPVDMRQRKC